MKKVIKLFIILIFGISLIGCNNNAKNDPTINFYLDGTYYGNCIYWSPFISSMPMNNKPFEFVGNTYEGIKYEKVDSIEGFFDNCKVFISDIDINTQTLEQEYDVYYFETNVNNDSHSGIYIFVSNDNLYLFRGNFSLENGRKNYTIWEGYILSKEPFFSKPQFNEEYILLKLTVESTYIDYDNYEKFYKDYNISYKQRYLIIDSYEEYFNIYSKYTMKEIDPLDKESSNKMFQDNVVLCYPRCISGSNEFFVIEYYYNQFNKEIVINYPNVEDGAYPDVVIGYCLDMVIIPKDVYNDMIK